MGQRAQRQDDSVTSNYQSELSASQNQVEDRQPRRRNVDLGADAPSTQSNQVGINDEDILNYYSENTSGIESALQSSIQSMTSSGVSKQDSTHLVQVEKSDLQENYMLVVQAKENIAQIINECNHTMTDSQIILFFSKEVRAALQVQDLPIACRSGNDKQYFIVELEFAQYIQMYQNWITIFYDTPNAATIKSTITEGGFNLDLTDMEKRGQYAVLGTQLHSVFVKQEAMKQMTSPSRTVEESTPQSKVELISRLQSQSIQQSKTTKSVKPFQSDPNSLSDAQADEEADNIEEIDRLDS